MEESNPAETPEIAETVEAAETTEKTETAEKPIETIDISEDTELIKEAQADLSKFDVLVCGGCHEVFHIIEEFQNHKTSGVCSNVSTVKCENDGKSQAWGFALWKSKQRRILKENSKNILTSWEFYQRWTKLDQTVKELWIAAGRNLQFCNKIASGKLAQSPRKNSVDKDPLALDEEPSNKTRTAVRTKEKEEEYNVEKIVGKRYNPRKKHWEYEVKWENYEVETWEPLTHLENCKSLVNEYELNLKLQKDKEKEKLTPAPRGRGRPRVNPGASPGVKVTPKKIPTTPIILNTSAGRPQRSCKQKALNQVKAWCGNISDGEEGGVKRPFEDDDSDDSFEKKIKLGGESDSEEDEPKLPIRKVAKIIHTYNNGSLKNRLPDNVLIPDAKGVVRISQKQLPSLSSGVYIMSKSSGIIKLDPAASKIATSGGQAIVKLSPKIGQTQIKIIKKEDGSKRVIQVKSHDTTPKLIPKIVQQPASKPTPPLKTNIERILKKVEAPPQKPKPTKVIVKEVDKTKPAKPANSRPDEESDDGIEELEFPTDLPLPSPESPPGEFILDPTTGKVAGLEYPDPEPEPVISNAKKETPTETLDNIVKLAAADITEDDLQPDMDPLALDASTASPATTSAATELKPTASLSILSAAIVNSNILQKTLLSPAAAPTKPKTQPRIITSTPTPAAAKQRPTPSIIRTPVAKPLVRPPKSAEVAKPKFNIAPMNPQAKNVYSNSNNVKKRIGNNSFYKANQPTKVTPIKKNPPPKQVIQQQQQHSSTPRPIISMPSLDEDTSSVVTTVAQVVVSPKVPEIVSTQQTTTTTTTTDLSTFTLQNDDKPVFITADDGTVYQVAGQNEEGQTILLTQDGDGQQCLVITNDPIQEITQQQQQEEQQEQVEEVVNQQTVLEPLEIAEEEPLVAQFIRTEPLSPGGTHKVVVMLPDGDVMVTQVTPEEYASLELDK